MTLPVPVAINGYQFLPALTPPERDALRRDIEDRGVLVPVELDEDGHILDGHHRAQIASELGIDYPTVVRSGLTEAEKLEHVFALNIARRHLSGHDRAGVIGECRRRGMSLRAIAEVVGVSHEEVRRDLMEMAVTDVTPDVEHEPEPLPAQPTRAERIAELRAKGWTQRAIAAEMGVSAATVSNVMLGKTGRMSGGPAAPLGWPATKRFIGGLREFADHRDARVVAASVPERNRNATAKGLRRLGTFLGSIALELEREERTDGHADRR